MGICCSKDKTKDVEELYPQFVKPRPEEDPSLSSERTPDAAPVQNGSGPPKSILRKAESTESRSESVDLSRQQQPLESPRPPPAQQTQSPQVPPPLPKHSSPPQATKQIDWNTLEREVQEENYRMLKDDYTRNVHQFLTNLLLMSVQFFRNFER